MVGWGIGDGRGDLLTKEIQLTKGQFTLVDDDDYEWLSKYKWHMLGNYAATAIRKGKIIKQPRMHRMIMGAKDGEIVDHVNGETLDNRKCNLRICTVQQNAANSRKPTKKDASSSYKGVSHDEKRNAWAVQIKTNGQSMYLGRFSNELAAATAYNVAAREYYKEFAKCNDIQELENYLDYKLTSSNTYHGVYSKDDGTWLMVVQNGSGKTLTSLTFSDERVAAYVYNVKVKELGLNNTLNDVPVVLDWEKYRIQRKRTSKYLGVSWHREKWQARTTFNNDRRYIGVFDTEKEAAIAYNQYIIEHNITGAILNEIKEEPDGDRLEEPESQQTQGQY